LNYYDNYNSSYSSGCSNISEGVLEKGLRISITTILQNTDDMLSTFYSSNRAEADQIDGINDAKVIKSENIMNAIGPALL